MAGIDARSHPGGRVDCDICIVGAGAAGIALALELNGTPQSVALVESGDTPFRHRPQMLYRGENIGMPNFSVAKSRLRRFGGSTTRWGGQCRPLDTLDFEKREWIDNSGWPLSRAELDPYYERAHRTVSLGPYRYEPSALSREGLCDLPLDPEVIETIIYQFSRRKDFAQTYGAALEASDNVTVWRNANAVEIVSSPNGNEVQTIKARTFNGRKIEFAARTYVLALGGIENARVMLASNRTERAGIGNRHDLVGRYFADHPYFTVGHFEPSGPAFDRNWCVIENYDSQGDITGGHGAFRLPEAVQKREQLNGAAAYLIRRPAHKTGPQYYAPAMRSANFLIEVLRHYDLSDGRLASHVTQAVKGAAQVTRNLAQSVSHKVVPKHVMSVRTVIETTPVRDSRVLLGPARDAFGMQRVQVDWRIREDDKRGLSHLIDSLGAAMARSGAGKLVVDDSRLENGWPASMVGGKHHIGTTRMHEDPAQGVVDPDCRVHGMRNLFIAGSSVFPTAGYANPTLTIVALAIRLADHLRSQPR
ncbi:GMC oxidoreductase [Roseobacter ponti]|uniref:GMC family oxidoreductase n=1 Tax=Roseobacter ponti TaxID=1891787 RepID=A0A858SPF2_9RHOB|nr:GMC oxidoreductase [Roseobacter ponti]QJF50280.1 GMC family oxidoreductase [Roseobacter ponti]